MHIWCKQIIQSKSGILFLIKKGILKGIFWFRLKWLWIINFSYCFSYNSFCLIPIISYSLPVTNVQNTNSLKQITCALCTKSWHCPKRALLTPNGLCTKSWTCTTSALCTVGQFLSSTNKVSTGPTCQFLSVCVFVYVSFRSFFSRCPIGWYIGFWQWFWHPDYPTRCLELTLKNLRCFNSDFDAVKSKFGLLIE